RKCHRNRGRFAAAAGSALRAFRVVFARLTVSGRQADVLLGLIIRWFWVRVPAAPLLFQAAFACARNSLQKLWGLRLGSPLRSSHAAAIRRTGLSKSCPTDYRFASAAVAASDDVFRLIRLTRTWHCAVQIVSVQRTHGCDSRT